MSSTRIASSLALSAILALGLFGCAHGPPLFDVRVRRTCLVLSAGGTRGIAELGAIQAVREAGIPISCVVGASVGALIGGLYASAPDQDTTQRFRELARAYLVETENEAQGRGWQAGAALATLAATLSGGVLVPAAAALGGYLLGAATTAQADRARMERVFRHQVGGARIEALPIGFATLHHERTGQGVTLVVDRTGDLAEAVGASIANPFVFEDVDITRDLKMDPGSDRVAATPVQDACRLFSDANLLVVNVSGSAAFYDATMRCPVREILIEVAPPPPRAFFQGLPGLHGSQEAAEFDNAWRAGHDRVAAALATP